MLVIYLAFPSSFSLLSYVHACVITCVLYDTYTALVLKTFPRTVPVLHWSEKMCDPFNVPSCIFLFV